MPLSQRQISFYTILAKTVFLALILTVCRSHKVKIATGLKKDLIRFKITWCNVRTARYDWKQILSPCGSRIAWSNINWNRKLHTDAEKSHVQRIEIKPAGFFSRFSIQSVSLNGKTKEIGGDSWRVFIRGPSSMAAQVFDKNNGTYEVVFLPMEPGNYEATIVLDYSLCNGMKDPPLDWFKRGCRHGSFQPQGSLGNRVKDFVQQSFREKIKFVVPSPLPCRSIFQVKCQRALDSRFMNIDIQESLVYQLELESFKAVSQAACKERCNLLWDGYGRWSSTQQWKPYQSNFPWIHHNGRHIKGSGILWIYGDSINRYFFQSLTRRPLCNQVFRACYHTMAWVYVLKETPSEEMDLRNGRKNINIPRVLDELRLVVSRSDMDENSALLLNAGVHLLKSTTFYYYQKIINGFIEVLRRYYRGKVIWKTTTSVHDQQELYSGCFRRFHTEQRVQLFNAYSRSAFCKAGYLVLDVYPISASYPGGTSDGVHYKDSVFYPVEEVLERYFGT